MEEKDTKEMEEEDRNRLEQEFSQSLLAIVKEKGGEGGEISHLFTLVLFTVVKF